MNLNRFKSLRKSCWWSTFLPFLASGPHFVLPFVCNYQNIIIWQSINQSIIQSIDQSELNGSGRMFTQSTIYWHPKTCFLHRFLRSPRFLSFLTVKFFGHSKKMWDGMIGPLRVGEQSCIYDYHCIEDSVIVFIILHINHVKKYYTLVSK